MVTLTTKNVKRGNSHMVTLDTAALSHHQPTLSDKTMSHHHSTMSHHPVKNLNFPFVLKIIRGVYVLSAAFNNVNMSVSLNLYFSDCEYAVAGFPHLLIQLRNRDKEREITSSDLGSDMG